MNKTIITLITSMLLCIAIVAATDMNIENDHLLVDSGGSVENVVCVTEDGQPLDIATGISRLCKDVNGLPGCQSTDAQATGLIISLDKKTGTDGCSDMTITATPEATPGKYYYLVNGVMGGVSITAETGSVWVNEVPEFGVVAAITTLGLAGCASTVRGDEP